MTDQSYTCSDFREEMILVALKNRLASENLTDEERGALEKRIKELESSIGLD